MLKITEFDLKTGQPINVAEPETLQLQPKEKEVGHSFLEHWLETNQIAAQFSMAKHYEGVNQSDRQRLESEGKVLVFTNGKDGYFTDTETAKLMTMGDADRGIEPIYGANKNSAHNVVAYGSLILSDGIASTTVGTAHDGRSAKILVIDDEKRQHGEIPLVDRQGKPISQAEIEKLYDKMGDGTMLVSRLVMHNLITPEEKEEITAKAFAKAGISGDITSLAEDESKLDAALAHAETGIERLVEQTVTQFRAATPNLPGMIKGTMGISEWCHRLGVDAIISKNDIKGDDQRLSQLGIQDVDTFWINRKSDGKYGEQRVGPQVKGCIPEATLREFNPQVVQQAEDLAAIAHDPQKLLQYYVEKKDRQREILEEYPEEDQPDPPPDWLYDIATSDPAGLMLGFSKVNYELDRFLRVERLENAVRGVRVPSAMAQHHSQLEPWEVCNKDLPHGAIVAYYRSPFPNVGAAAIGINNTEIIHAEDSEAFRKAGVAYLNPWTAKNIAITDFDKDANGFFVGYESTVKDFPQQIRAQLQSVKDLPPDQQYEAGRALISDLIDQVKVGQEPRLKPAAYPLAVEEFVERNAPDCKPLQIEKQAKIKHPWEPDAGESHAMATWRAWEITANNPTGKVANLSMTLQSLALETQYIANNQKEPLLRQISSHYAKLLKQAADGKINIPTDEDFVQKGFPAYHLRERIKDIAQANQQINQISDPQQRVQFVEQKLGHVHTLLKDLVEGPIAENLQTAVDVAKSARGIDEGIQRFAKALQHKEHWLRQHQKDPNVYTQGNELPTNTEEPIGWAVETSNRLYKESRLPEKRNEAFRDLFPENCTLDQREQALKIAHIYKNLQRTALETKKRLQENRPEDQQPTLSVTVPKTGSQVIIQRLCDADIPGDSPIWRTSGQQQDWQIQIHRNPKIDGHNPEALMAKLVYTVNGQAQETSLGYVAPASAERHDLIKRLQGKQSIDINAPIVEIRPPFAIQNDTEAKLKQASAYIKQAVADIPDEERKNYVSAMWRYPASMDVAVKLFTPEVVERLQQPVPELKVTGLQYESNEAGRIPDGEYTIKFGQFNYVKKSGEEKTSPSIAIVLEDGQEKRFGVIDPRSVRLPEGTIARASIQTEGNIAKVQVSEVLVRDLPVFQQDRETKSYTPIPSTSVSSQPIDHQGREEALTLETEILATDAAHCLYRFVNNDLCESYKPSDPRIKEILEVATQLGFANRCEYIEQQSVGQTIATIDFPNLDALKHFEETIAPLPIQYRYEGEWCGGFQFIEPSEEKRLEATKMMAVPDSGKLAKMAPDPLFVVGKGSTLEIGSVGFTNQDHSFAVFSDLMTLDIDRPKEQVLNQFQERCKLYPDELWAIYSTQKGVHAMRLDSPCSPQDLDSRTIEIMDVDPNYMKMCVQENQWIARVNAKSGREDDRIHLERFVGSGTPDSRLLKDLEAYQKLLVQNEMDGVESLDKLTALNKTSTVLPSSELLTIVTDGACSGNPGPGGWGAILLQGNTYREIGGHVPETTNNRMEMMAAIEALKYAKAEGLLDNFTPVKIITDSQLLINGATGEWKRKANQDLWTDYNAASRNVNLSFEWVRGHNGHELNERVDRIAHAFSKGQQPRLKQEESPVPAPAVVVEPVPIGDLVNGKIVPFPPKQEQKLLSTEPDLYQPSCDELRQWYTVARIKGDDHRIGEVKALGVTLKNLYNIEQGSPSPAVSTPPDYRHAAVTIPDTDRREMQRDIMSLRSVETQLETVETVRRRSEAQR